MSIREVRLQFSSLRAGYLTSGRIIALYGMPFVAGINLGYGIESYLKHGLIELGIKNKKIQYSHDLKYLLQACQQNGLYDKIQVSEDFIDYANSLFQMRYPSSSIQQLLKAYERNNMLGAGWDFLLAYDDLILQMDMALLNYSEDFISSSIAIITAGIDSHKNRLFFFQNLYLLEQISTYFQIIKSHYKNNKSAIEVLSNGPDQFWHDDALKTIFYVSRLEAKELYRDSAKVFAFSGEVIRNSKGDIIGFQF